MNTDTKILDLIIQNPANVEYLRDKLGLKVVYKRITKKQIKQEQEELLKTMTVNKHLY